MATAIEMNPVEHATKVTDFVRIDDDQACTIRVSDGGTPQPIFHYNFSGIPEGEIFRPTSDNISLVRVTKDGDNASVTIQVNMYYAAGSTGANLPRAWIYGQPFANPDTADNVKTTFTEDDLDPSNLVQNFPLVIWNPLQLKDANEPAANTATSTYTVRSLYARLGTTADRQEYLKQLIRANHLDHLERPLWFEGFGAKGITTLKNGIDTRKANYLILMEAWTRAISVNANLEDTTTPITTVGERKFNLLEGDIKLSGLDVLNNLATGVGDAIIGNTQTTAENRSAWRLVRIGSAPSSSPYKYVPNGTTTNWGSTGGTANTVAINEINIQTGSTIPSTMTWWQWLRS